MPQGTLKKNKKAPQVPTSLKKGKRHVSVSKMKKGAMRFAPKKAKAKKGKLVQKQLERAINKSIEQEMTQRASKDLTAFKLLKKEKKPEGKKK